MPDLPHPLVIISVVVAVILIVVGRVYKRLPVAIGGYVLLALTAVLVLLGKVTA